MEAVKRFILGFLHVTVGQWSESAAGKIAFLPKFQIAVLIIAFGFIVARFNWILFAAIALGIIAWLTRNLATSTPKIFRAKGAGRRAEYKPRPEIKVAAGFMLWSLVITAFGIADVFG